MFGKSKDDGPARNVPIWDVTVDGKAYPGIYARNEVTAAGIAREQHEKRHGKGKIKKARVRRGRK